MTMSKKNMMIVSIVVLVVVAGGAFYGGMLYGKNQNARPAFNPANFQGARANRTGGGAANGANFISGSLISKDNNSITISLPAGGSKIIFYSNATQIQQMVSGTAANLLPGNCQLVNITGTDNSDGSVTAQTIQIRPDPKCMPTTQTPGPSK
jgi:hypothetical protein